MRAMALIVVGRRVIIGYEIAKSVYFIFAVGMIAVAAGVDMAEKHAFAAKVIFFPYGRSVYKIDIPLIA